MDLYFATGNDHKFDEARRYLEGEVPGLSLKQCKGDFPEIQARDLEAVARFKIQAAIAACKGNVFMEDAGLFVPALNGFPGVYSADVKRMIGCQGILKLLAGVPDPAGRHAYFEACTCLHLRDRDETLTFTGRVDGTIAVEERGTNGFGYDPIFVPDEPPGNRLTFAEMDPATKIAVSHRSRALAMLTGHLRTIL